MAVILANRVEDITDADNRGAVLGGYRNGVLVFLGNVEDDSIILECAVVVICADTVCVIEVRKARAVVSRDGENVCYKCVRRLFGTILNRHYLYLIFTGLKTDCIYTIVVGVATNQVTVNF